MATHFSILAWRIPWTEKPGRLLYCVSLYIYIYIIQYCKSTILQFKKSLFKNSVTQEKRRDFSGVQGLRLRAPNVRHMRSMPGRGIRSRTPQLRVHVPQLKILQPATETRHSQINKYKYFLKENVTGEILTITFYAFSCYILMPQVTFLERLAAKQASTENGLKRWLTIKNGGLFFSPLFHIHLKSTLFLCLKRCSLYFYSQ